MKAPDIMAKAAAHMAARASTYDSPEGERSMGRAVGALNSVLGRVALSESEGWLFMQLLKDVRDRTSPTPHADSLEDCVAYAALKAEARLSEVPPWERTIAEGGMLPAKVEEAATFDWSSAPEWANWAAVDSSGALYWFSDEPEWEAVSSSGGGYYVHSGDGNNDRHLYYGHSSYAGHKEPRPRGG